MNIKFSCKDNGVKKKLNEKVQKIPILNKNTNVQIPKQVEI